MPRTKIEDPKVKREFQLLRLRGVLDPKKHCMLFMKPAVPFMPPPKLTQMLYSQEGHAQRSVPKVLSDGHPYRRSNRLLQWANDTQGEEANPGRRSASIRRVQLQVQDQICEDPGEADKWEKGTLQKAHGPAEAWLNAAIMKRLMPHNVVDHCEFASALSGVQLASFYDGCYHAQSLYLLERPSWSRVPIGMGSNARPSLAKMASWAHLNPEPKGRGTSVHSSDPSEHRLLLVQRTPASLS